MSTDEETDKVYGQHSGKVVNGQRVRVTRDPFKAIPTEYDDILIKSLRFEDLPEKVVVKEDLKEYVNLILFLLSEFWQDICSIRAFEIF